MLACACDYTPALASRNTKVEYFKYYPRTLMPSARIRR